MNFLNPLALFGLLAASIPLLLHLLNLRKQEKINFSTLRFLIELQKSKIKNIKIKQLLLLILRILIIAMIVLAFARPVIKNVIPGFENYAKTSVVILIDNSYSMDLSDEYGNRLNQAKKAANSIINGLKEGDEVAIIPIASLSNSSIYDRNFFNFSSNPNLLAEQISKTKIIPSSASLHQGLRLANLLLSDSKNLNKEIYILSDGQSNVYNQEAFDRTKYGNNIISFVRIGTDIKANNYSIDSIKINNSILSIGRNIDVEATITNRSGKDIRGLVTSMIINDEKIAQQAVDLKSDESKVVKFSSLLKNYGFINGKIEIENDDLMFDNVRYFSCIVPNSPNVLIVGENQTTNYLNLIANQLNTNNEIANFEFVSPNSFASKDIRKYQVVIITSSLSNESEADRIKQYIDDGGSVLLFPDANPANASIDKLCNVSGFGEITKAETSAKTNEFSSADLKHPLFEGVFIQNDQANAKIESPKINSCFVVKGGVRIIDFQGQSLLSEIKSSNGRILYFGLPLDAKSSNFEQTSLFPAFILRSIMYLNSNILSYINAEINQNIVVSLPKKLLNSTQIKVLDPNKKEYFQNVAFLPSSSIFSIDKAEYPGVFQFSNMSNQAIFTVSVNTPQKESILDYKSENEVKEFLKKFTSNTDNIIYEDKWQELSGKINRIKTGTEIWQICILLAILFAFTEMWVQRSYKNEK